MLRPDRLDKFHRETNKKYYITINRILKEETKMSEGESKNQETKKIEQEEGEGDDDDDHGGEDDDGE